MSDTPRTDALYNEICALHKNTNLDDFAHYYDAAGKFATIARQLERELAERTAERDATKGG